MAGYRINGQDLLLQDAANVLAQRNGADAQTFRLYNQYTSGTNYSRVGLAFFAGDIFALTGETGAVGTDVDLRLRASGTKKILLGNGGVDRWELDGSGHLIATTDDGVNIGASNATRPSALFLAAPAITAGSGTGVTLNDSGSVRDVTYKVTVTYAALAAAALTADKVIATLPAKTRLIKIIADTTTKYIGGGVTEATLIVGKTTGGNQYVVSHDVFTAAITRGLADADLGTSINRANAIQGGDLASWTATTDVSVRLTTVTANTDQLTQGSTTYYLVTEKMP